MDVGSILDNYGVRTPTFEIPLLDGASMTVKRFTRYGELVTFRSEQEKFSKRAVGGAIPEMVGIEGLTRKEADVVYSMHILTVSPPISIPEAAALLSAPAFVAVFVQACETHSFNMLEVAFSEEIEKGKG